ncbi:MAG: protein kinase [Methanosarcinaceae archaeon]|nr:protein kinase [Methanosarcinaceae archaeon]
MPTRKNLIHRDLNPVNCLLTEDGTLKITDFGLAKIEEFTGKAPVATHGKLTKLSDDTFSEGQFGFCVELQNTHVHFSNLVVKGTQGVDRDQALNKFLKAIDSSPL